MTSLTIPSNTDVTPAARDKLFKNKLEKSFNLFVNASTDHRVDVAIEGHDTETPARSSSNQIWVSHNPAKLGRLSTATAVKRLKGLLIHELSHVLFTPRNRTDLVKAVTEKSLFNEFNILEDNRIENLTVAKMSGVKPWLTQAVLVEIIEQFKPADYVLLAGRKYLDKDIVTNARNAFRQEMGDTTLNELEHIVNSYIRITFHEKGDKDKALDLIMKLAILLRNMHDSEIPNTANHEGECSSPKSEGSQKPMGKRDTDKLMEEVEQMAADNQPSDDQSSDDQDTKNGSSSSSDAVQSAKEAMSDAISSSDEEIRKELKDTVGMSKSKNHRTDSKSIGKVKRSNINYPLPGKEDVLVTQEFLNAYTRFSKELQEVKSMSDPMWDRKTSEGRLNVRSLLLDGDLETAFDKWDDSRAEASDIECVVLLDISGSMNSMMKEALQSMWVIKKAFDNIEASTTVLQFGTAWSVMYDSTERAGTKPRREDWTVGGGTSPLKAIKYAQQILNNSPKAIKVMLIITDGHWADEHLCEDTITQMRDSNVLTGLAFLQDEKSQEYLKEMGAGTPATEDMDESELWSRKVYGINEDGLYKIDGHRCEVVADTTQPADLPKFAQELARISRARLQNV